MIRTIFGKPSGVFSVVVISVMLLVALTGSLWVPYGVNEIDISRALSAPSALHWFGTDELGRDIFTRTVLASGISMRVSLTSVALALTFGALTGMIAGYFGGFADALLMRIVDVMFAFPVLLLALAIVAILGPGIETAIIAIAVVYTPIFARIARSATVSISQEPFIQSSKVTGASSARILLQHILPNIAAPLIVQTSISLAFAVLSEAALSFLGLGAQPPDPTWGRMLFDAKGFLTQAWWMAVLPGSVVLFTVLAFNLLGDNLRDALDTSTQRKADA
jgi:peptide/nickel transport system permease protein